MLKATAIKAGKKAGRSRILEMAKTASDALLETIRIIAVCKHCSVMVAFQHKCVALTQYRFDMGRRAAGIGQYA